MSKIVQFKPRYKKQAARTDSFPKLIAIAMIGSFAIGAAASQFIGSTNSVSAQAAASGNHIVAASGKQPQQTEQVAFNTAKPRVTYKLCVGSVRINCIVDGDTLWSN